MKVKQTKKGQFFSIITILMVLPLVALSITFAESMSGYGGDIGEQVRLKSGYYYYSSLDQDLARTSEKIGRRAMLSAVSSVVENGEGLNSSSETLEELFINGTIDNESHMLMNHSGIDYWLEAVEEISVDRGYRINLSREDPEVMMYDPYMVSFPFNYSLVLRDSRGLFSLRKNNSKTNEVSLEGLEDPLVALGTGGRYHILIEPCGFNYTTEELVSGTSNNSWSSGQTVVNPGSLSAVDNPEEKVVVVDSVSDTDKLNDFSAAVVGEAVNDDVLNVPYVSEVNVDNIPNQTRVVVDGNESKVLETENLYSMWRETCYMSGEAPSFLHRLENNLTAESPNGLFVLVNKGEIDEEGLEVKERSNLAHIYFSEEDVKNCRVKGMPESFLIDEGSSGKLGIKDSLLFNCV